MFSDNKKTALIISIFAVFLFVLDRYLKGLALVSSTSYTLIPEWLSFNFVKNYFIAFSLPLGGTLLLLIISAILIGLLGYSASRLINKQYTEAALLFGVMLGALSNLYDRLSLGFVVDYLDLRYFTVFNVADSVIVVFVFLFIIISYKKTPANN